MIYTGQILHDTVTKLWSRLASKLRGSHPVFLGTTLFYLSDQIWPVTRLRKGENCGYVKVFTGTTMLHTETAGPIVQNFWNC